MRRTLLLWLLWFITFAPATFAHEVRPAYLQLQQTSADTYDVLWKVPGRGEDLRLGLDVQLPKGCSNLSDRRGVFAAHAYTERWRVRRVGGITTPSSASVRENAGMLPGSSAPTSAWWARLAAKPASSPSWNSGVITVMSGRCVPPR